MLVQPVAAAIIAWAVIGEALGPWQAAGGAIVLGGIMLARRGSRDV
jgi:drug/metabolite transporter (DMT)-like permease